MHPFEDSEEVINVIFLGSDQRSNSYGHRTDTIMLLSFDLEEGTVTLMSIPRDLYVFIPGWRVDRINTADARGGPERVQETILYNFGIEVDHWARIRLVGSNPLSTCWVESMSMLENLWATNVGGSTGVMESVPTI